MKKTNFRRQARISMVFAVLYAAIAVLYAAITVLAVVDNRAGIAVFYTLITLVWVAMVAVWVRAAKSYRFLEGVCSE